MKDAIFVALFFLALHHCHSAEAAQVVPKWGFEKNIISEGTGSAERTYGLEYLHPIGAAKAMHLKAEVGAWWARQAGRSSSFYTSAQWGYRVAMPWGLFVEAYVGPGWVAITDDRNSSHVNIFHDVGIGWLQHGWGLGLGFKHISNAGVVPPNLGRDFGSVRFIIPLGG
jgi:hypothetical protein